MILLRKLKDHCRLNIDFLQGRNSFTFLLLLFLLQTSKAAHLFHIPLFALLRDCVNWSLRL